ncbi:hypothetical protein TWF281_008912 [Arthrobotrys megalospora]
MQAFTQSIRKSSIFQYDTCNQILRFNPSDSQTEAYWLSFDTSLADRSITPLELTTAFTNAAKIQHHMDVRSWDPLLSIGLEYVSFVDLDARSNVDKGGVRINKLVQDMVDDAPLKGKQRLNIILTFGNSVGQS